ncbi:MAG TPA: Ig-like domain-containing protein [Bryobacteraceae bacterium]|nr:Ig-like domain-containing protein [Bryobacteraceae bacterium]
MTAWILLMASTAAFGQTSYLFQLPGQTSNSHALVGWGDDNFSRVIQTANGPLSSFQIVPTPSGNKFYVLAGNGILSANATLTTFTPIAGVNATVSSAVVSPDGKYLLVIADHLYVIDTTSDAIVGTDPGVPGGTTVGGVAVSRDSAKIWVLSNVNPGSSLTTVNLATRIAGSSLSLPYTGTSVTLSPRGRLYVAFDANQVDEIDPATLTVSSQIPVQALPGPLRYTPDGTTAYIPNRNVCSSCYSLLKLNLATRTVSNWPPNDGSVNPPPIFDDVYIAGNSQVFALASTYPTTKLWDVTSTPFSVAPSALGNAPSPGLPINFVSSIAVSNERPSARFLYLFIPQASSPLIRWNLASNGIDQQIGASVQTGTNLSFAPIPPQTGAANFLRIDSVQTLGAGAAASLSAQVLDSLGRPVFNVPACFTADTSTLTIANPSQITNSEGWVQTAITVPTLSGSYTVTLGVGQSCLSSPSASTTFSITVGGSGGTTSPQFTIVSGNGQLIRQTIAAPQPLTVKLTDASGAPVAGAEVGFQIAEGAGHLDTLSTFTDSDGLASSNFISGSVNSAVSFQASTITATSALGAVTFVETTHNALTDEPNQPIIRIATSPEGGDLTISEGGRLSSAITAQTTSLHVPQFNVPIPNIGIRLADPSNRTLPLKVASCVGSTLGDNLGVSRCDVFAPCLEVGTAFPYVTTGTIAVGELGFANLRITVTKGAPSLLSIVSGNNQINNPGTFLNLTARVTDACNHAAGNVPVTWTVIQGTGTIESFQSPTFNDGTSSARLRLGSTAGTVQVQASASGITPVVFTLTIRTVVSSLGVVSGGGQSVNTGQVFPSPVVFVVRDASNNPVPGIVVNLSVSGSATLSNTTATTDSQGQVRTTVTAGASPGTITVSASFGNLSATATLSSHLPGPEVTVSNFKNAASLANGLTPCGLITVIGNGLAPGVQGVLSGLSAFGPLPYSLGPVSSITVNNIPAPIQAVANQSGVQQINFQAPCELQAGTATVVINVSGASATVSNVPVFAVQPGIFTYAGPNNIPYGAVIRAVDGSYVTPSNPARRGERLYMVVTGMGQGTPTIVTNSAGTGTQNIALPVVVGISDRGVPVLSARYLFGSIGAYLIEFQVPTDSPVGPNQSLAVAVLTNNGTNYVFGNPVFLPAVTD